MATSEIIREKLQKQLNPLSLEVINESDMHAGHAGSPNTGESHFRIKIIAECFSNQSRLKIHQMINEVLKDELKEKIHALAIEAKAP